MLEYVARFADKAHGTQVRKYTGERYIVHPVRVMELTRQYTDDVCVHAAALLHDVLEDTAVSADQMEGALREVMTDSDAEKVVNLVTELTDVFVKDNYPSLNRRSRKEKEALRLSGVSPKAQLIKYADIIDNVNDLVSQDTDFAQVYIREAKKMLRLMASGNPDLRKKAMSLVDKFLEDLQPPHTILSDG